MPTAVTQRRRNVSDLAYKVRRSWLFHYVVIFLHEKEIVRLQLLERYFYDVQIPRLLPTCQVHLAKTRLHFLNQDYIILFEMLNFTKRKVRVGCHPSMFPLSE